MVLSPFTASGRTKTREAEWTVPSRILITQDLMVRWSPTQGFVHVSRRVYPLTGDPSSAGWLEVQEGQEGGGRHGYMAQ